MKDPSCLHPAVISLKSVRTHRGSMEDRIFINLSLFMWVKDACSVVEMFVAAGLRGGFVVQASGTSLDSCVDHRGFVELVLFK